MCPNYDYLCPDCGNVTEQFHRMADKPAEVECSCGAMATSLPSIGGIQSDEPAWLNDEVRGAIQAPDERPITSRTEYNKYLLDKGLVCTG
jgi:putative FmdB family regulatory protein